MTFEEDIASAIDQFVAANGSCGGITKHKMEIVRHICKINSHPNPRLTKDSRDYLVKELKRICE